MAHWRRYVPVAQRQAKARRQAGKLLKKGQPEQPVVIDGRVIALSFWGKAWCTHLESFSDYSNRLPRGRTYVRNGSVCHLDIKPGHVEALVAGSSLYTIKIDIAPLKKPVWEAIKRQAAGGVGTMIELLQGRFSDEVMRVVTDPAEGLFPKPNEITLRCSCPDWAEMCKHVAAALYGVGNRLDARPDLLFLLRGVDPEELLDTEISLPAATGDSNQIPDNALSALFGIEIDTRTVVPRKQDEKRAPRSPSEDKAKPAATTRKKRTAAPTTATIRRLRKKLDMSTAGLAKYLEVTEATICRWESTVGPLKLQRRTLEALNRALDENA